MALGGNHKALVRGAALDHVALLELDGLGALAAQLARDGDLHPLGRVLALHDEVEHRERGAARVDALEQLETQRLGLRLGAEVAAGHVVEEEREGFGLQVEALGQQRLQLVVKARAIAEQRGGLCGHDGDLHLGRAVPHAHTCEAFFGDAVSEDLLQFGLEEALAYDLLGFFDFWNFRLFLRLLSFGILIHFYDSKFINF